MDNWYESSKIFKYSPNSSAMLKLYDILASERFDNSTSYLRQVDCYLKSSRR